MIFNSIIYLIFLLVVVAAYYIFPAKIKWLWLLSASVVYYLSFIPVFVFLILGLVLINYFFSLWLGGTIRTGIVITAAIIINILVLCLFKYFNVLFPSKLVHLYSVDYFFRTAPGNKMILPLGLSYITFTLISYLIEIKRKNISVEKHLGYFSLYVFFFPKIAQGPIERPKQLMDQFREEHSFDYGNIIEGLKLILSGYFKKLVVADRLAIFVNAVYDNSTQHNGTSLAVATFFFAFQIYADFSGYTDIALGSARLFGFVLTDNFKRPYLANSIKEFWNRWHITFSTWLRDYIFLPLAYFLSHRIKKSFLYISAEKWIYMIASLVTFSICGIWHGVGWNYLMWGLLFGIYLTYSNWMKDFNKNLRKGLHIKKKSGYYNAYNIISTFILLLFSWIVFRAPSLKEAFAIAGKIITAHGSVFYQPFDLLYGSLGILALLAIDLKEEYFGQNLIGLHSKYQFVRIAGIVVIILVILLAGVFDGGQFIYFQF